MIALASVDLPEPLGPISVWISPERTCRSTPLRICFSPAETWRFLISRSAMSGGLAFDRELGGEDAGPLLEGDQLGQRGALQRADDAQLHAGPEKLGGAVAVIGLLTVRAADTRLGWRIGHETVHRCYRALE